MHEQQKLINLAEADKKEWEELFKHTHGSQGYIKYRHRHGFVSVAVVVQPN